MRGIPVFLPAHATATRSGIAVATLRAKHLRIRNQNRACCGALTLAGGRAYNREGKVFHDKKPGRSNPKAMTKAL